MGSQQKLKRVSAMCWHQRDHRVLPQTLWLARDGFPRWGRLWELSSAQFGHIRVLSLVEKSENHSIIHTVYADLTFYFLGIAYAQYYLSGYLHHAALPEQTFPSTFQTKRSARQNCFKLTFLWKGFLTGKDCVNTWFATSPFWLVLRRVAVSACHRLL